MSARSMPVDQKVPGSSWFILTQEEPGSVWFIGGLGLCLLTGCGGKELLAISPATLDFGEVDFQAEEPAAGYDAMELRLENASGRSLDISFPGFPDDRLRITALFASQTPPTLSALAPDEAHVVQVGVIAYELGERDTLVETALRVSAGGEQWMVPVQYVPVRNIDGDSGL